MKIHFFSLSVTLFVSLQTVNRGSTLLGKYNIGDYKIYWRLLYLNNAVVKLIVKKKVVILID